MSTIKYFFVMSTIFLLLGCVKKSPEVSKNIRMKKSPEVSKNIRMKKSPDVSKNIRMKEEVKNKKDTKSLEYAIKLISGASNSPIKTQSVIIATVLDNKGRPLSGKKVLWQINGTGRIIRWDDYGDNLGFSEKNVITYTKSRPNLYTMGTVGTDDDIRLKAGQTWVAITSPVEGKTQISAMCPTILDIHKKKAIAVKHWKNLKISWPKHACMIIGRSHTFKFNLRKSSDQKPIIGWPVKWTVLPSYSAAYLYTTNVEEKKTVLLTRTDEKGNAEVSFQQKKYFPTMEKIKVELFDSKGKFLMEHIIFLGLYSLAWGELVAKGPREVALDENFVFTINFLNLNHCDEYEANVVVKCNLGKGFKYKSSTLKPTKIQNNKLIWRLGNLPRDVRKDIKLTLIATKTGKFVNKVSVSSCKGYPITSTTLLHVRAPK